MNLPQSREEWADALGVGVDQITPEVEARIASLNDEYDRNAMAQANAIDDNLDQEIQQTQAQIPALDSSIQSLQPDMAIPDPEPRWEPASGAQIFTAPKIPGAIVSDDNSIPFQNAYRGPAGEYSDRYKAIVDQYRNEVDSAQQLRNQQMLDRLGVPALSAYRSPYGYNARPIAPHLFKSRNDVVRIDPLTGQTELVYRSPEPTPRVSTAVPRPYTSPERLAIIEAAKKAKESALAAYYKANRDFITDPKNEGAIEGRRTALRDLLKANQEFDAITNPGATAAVVAATPSSNQKAPRVAVGGYKIGARYKGGLIYLGGDPYDLANSWKKAQ